MNRNAPAAASTPLAATLETTAGTDYRMANGLPLIEWDVAHLHALDDIAQRAKAEAAHRSAAMTRTNQTRDVPKYAIVTAALEGVALFDRPLPALVRLVRKRMLDLKLCSRDERPGRRFVAERIQEAREIQRRTLL